jgi:hypothetical protein
MRVLFFTIFVCYCFLITQCKNDYRLRLLKFKMDRVEYESDLDFFNNKRFEISYKKKLVTTVKVYYNTYCDLCCNLFNGSIRITRDTIFLIADYNYIGEIRYGSLQACSHVFEYKIKNLPDTIPLEFILDY